MRTDVTILGVHVKSGGYPNVTFRVNALKDAPELQVREVGVPFQAPGRSGGLAKGAGGLPRALGVVGRLIASHTKLFFLWFLRRKGPAERVYIPYPAIGVLLGLGLLPRRWRPARIIADCFISVYDTVVGDRQLLRAGTWSAELLRRLEARAYRTADAVLVDTELNAEYLERTFGLEKQRIAALPLAINEGAYHYARYVPVGETCRVVFVGTFVPLQGVETIAEAALLLRNDAGIEIRLVGSGQASANVERILAGQGCRNLRWEKEWMADDELAEEVRQADVCLGIFGSGEKAQRVWPLKNYSYMASGRAIITGDTVCARELLSRTEGAAFVTVPPGDGGALAEVIRRLAVDPSERVRLAGEARAFFDAHLRSDTATRRLVSMLCST